MQHFIRSRSAFLLTLALSSACVTLSDSGTSQPPPPIDDSMTSKDAIEAGLTHGGETLAKVKSLLVKRKQLVSAARGLEKPLIEKFSTIADTRLINSVSLYQHSRSAAAPQLVKKMLDASKKLHRQLAWHIAANMPSQAMAQVIEGFLTQAISDGQLGEYLDPSMADAIVNNRLTNSYTILRQGLMATNHYAYAQGMIALIPRQASEDFMDYLSQAPVEELRQLNLTTLDLFTCMELLKHLQKYPVAINHPNFQHLFFYATSRNIGLAEHAQALLTSYSPQHNRYLAYLFTVQPEWVQLAYIEGIRRNITPLAATFLNEVKKNSRHQEIIDEINSIVN